MNRKRGDDDGVYHEVAEANFNEQRVTSNETTYRNDAGMERRLATEGTEITEVGIPRRYLPRGSGGVAAAAAGAGEQVIVEQ